VDKHSVVDEYGRRTTFTGEKLVYESTDTMQGNKPQWLEVTVWRTEARQWVVRRKTHYRIRHLTDRCPRAEGYELVDPTEIDTYPCSRCNTNNIIEPARGLAQASRILVEVYGNSPDLIDSFKSTDGVKTYSNLSRTILSELAEQDEEVDTLWNTQVVA
jgi:hypothetical protein